jgi:hypothetical protein
VGRVKMGGDSHAITDRTSLAASLPDKARIELNRLSLALSRCVDQARCVEIMECMKAIEERR